MNEKENTLMILFKSVIKGSFFRFDTVSRSDALSALKDIDSIKALIKKIRNK